MDTLRELVGREQGSVVIDLTEVTLIDREAVSFLALSKAKGVELKNGPLIYVSGSPGRGSEVIWNADPNRGGGDDIGGP